jgi:hypothetical protein
MRKTLILGLLCVLALVALAIFSGWRAGEVPQAVLARLPGRETEPPATQRAASDGDAKAAAQERSAAEATPPQPEPTAETPPSESVAWLPASTPVSLFGGGVLYFCHDLEITRSKSPSEALAAALAYPDASDGETGGLLAVADVHWPADSGDLEDLETLANAALKQETLCEAYGDIWDLATLKDSTLPDDTYLTGIARFIDDDVDPQWIVRIGVIKED